LAIIPNHLQGDNEERRIIENLEDSQFSSKLPPFARSDQFDNSDSPGPGIRKRISLKRAWREGVPLAAYDPDCDMLERYDRLAEIVEHGGIDG
jgi:chromosome partitioning protein